MNNQTIKPRTHIKTILKNMVLNIWESITQKWDDLSLLGKCLFVMFIAMPATFITLANIFDKQTNIVIELIHMFAGFSVLLWALAGLFWASYMFETPQRRRKLYLILMAVLWLAFGYSHFFGEDPDIQYRFMMMAVVGSVWLIVPLFLSMFRPVVYYRDDD